MKRSYTTKKKKGNPNAILSLAKRKNTAVGMIPKNLTTLHIKRDLTTNLLYNADIKHSSFWPRTGPKNVLFLFCKRHVYLKARKGHWYLAGFLWQTSSFLEFIPTGTILHTLEGEKPRCSHFQYLSQSIITLVKSPNN